MNSRFVSNGPVHNLLNNVASSVLSSLALHESDPMMHGGKRQKVQDNPAFILNLRCPLSHYDLHSEPSKTIIEFKVHLFMKLYFILGFVQLNVQVSISPYDADKICNHFPTLRNFFLLNIILWVLPLL